MEYGGQEERQQVMDTAALLFPDGVGYFSIIIGVKNSEASYPDQGYYATLLVNKPRKEPRALAMGRPMPDLCDAVASLLVVLAAEVNVVDVQWLKAPVAVGGDRFVVQSDRRRPPPYRPREDSASQGNEESSDYFWAKL